MIDLSQKAGHIGLKMNTRNCRTIKNLSEHALVDLPVETAENYIYLGHKISLGKENQTTEVERRYC